MKSEEKYLFLLSLVDFKTLLASQLRGGERVRVIGGCCVQHRGQPLRRIFELAKYEVPNHFSQFLSSHIFLI